MENEHRHHEWESAQRSTRPDAIERELNAALAKYTAVEPRARLEDRILAHVRSERESIPNRAWRHWSWRRWSWQWSIASAVVAIAAVVLVTLTLDRRPHRSYVAKIAHQSSNGTPTVTGTQPAMLKPVMIKPTLRPARHSYVTAPHDTASHAAAMAKQSPKLDVFPSPQPLSTEELALERYVEQYRDEAILIAQSQEQYRQETRLKMHGAGLEAPWPESFDSNDLNP